MPNTAKATVLRLDEAGQELWPELSQCGLDVATTQPTSGRSTLQQGFLALSGKCLECLTTSYALNGCLLCLWSLQAKQCLLLSQCWKACLLVRLEQGLQGIELPALLCHASFCCACLNTCGLACCIGLHQAADQLRASND